MVSDCTVARVENDARTARHKQYAHTVIAYSHLTAPHSCDHMGYVRRVGHAARSGIIAHILPGLSLTNGLITIDCRRIHPLTQADTDYYDDNRAYCREG